MFKVRSNYLPSTQKDGTVGKIFFGGHCIFVLLGVFLFLLWPHVPLVIVPAKFFFVANLYILKFVIHNPILNRRQND